VGQFLAYPLKAAFSSNPRFQTGSIGRNIRINANGKGTHHWSSLDTEEEALHRAVGSDDHEFGCGILAPERKAELQEAARNALDDEHVQISLRIFT
jgi:hypothetical protein